MGCLDIPVPVGFQGREKGTGDAVGQLQSGPL